MKCKNQNTLLPFECLLVLMTRPAMVIGSIGLMVLSFLYWDKAIGLYFYQLNLRESFFLSELTKLGLGGVYLSAFFIFGCFFRYIYPNPRWEARSWFLFLCMLLPSLICLLLKIFLGRARPDLWFQYHFYGFYGLNTKALFWSFPSGHTTNIMALVFGLGAIFPRYCYALITLGLAVAASRVLLTQHYLSDVMAAAYFALLEVGILYQVLRRQSWLVSAWSPAV